MQNFINILRGYIGKPCILKEVRDAIKDLSRRI